MAASDLARLVSARRAELGLSQEEAVAKAGRGISTSNWSKIENGREGPYRQSTYAAIDRALGWQVGTAEKYAFWTKKGMEFEVFAPELDAEEIEATLKTHEARIQALEELVEGMSERLLALAERATLQDVDDEMHPGESRTAR